MIVAMATLCIIVNVFFARKLPLIETFILVLHVVGFFAILLPLWALSPIRSAHSVFTEFTNAYARPAQGVGCLVGNVGPMYSLLGPDPAVHMCKVFYITRV